MLKRILSAVLVVALFVCLPLLSGCGDDIKTQRHLEVHDQPIGQHEVVE